MLTLIVVFGIGMVSGATGVVVTACCMARRED